MSWRVAEQSGNVIFNSWIRETQEHVIAAAASDALLRCSRSRKGALDIKTTFVAHRRSLWSKFTLVPFVDWDRAGCFLHFLCSIVIAGNLQVYERWGWKHTFTEQPSKMLYSNFLPSFFKAGRGNSISRSLARLLFSYRTTSIVL